MNTFDAALLILRLGVGLTFAAHGAQKLFGWWDGIGIRGWQGAVAGIGYRPVTLFTAVSALAEFGGGLLLAAGLFTPLAGAVLVGQSVVIIGQVHWPNGFFNS
jgi:putative oxidoreductase